MNGALEFQKFFKDVSKNRVDLDKLWSGYVYIALSEWHWNYDDIMDTPCHFVIDALRIRADMKKKEEKEMKKSRRRK